MDIYSLSQLQAHVTDYIQMLFEAKQVEEASEMLGEYVKIKNHRPLLEEFIRNGRKKCDDDKVRDLSSMNCVQKVGKIGRSIIRSSVQSSRESSFSTMSKRGFNQYRRFTDVTLKIPKWNFWIFEAMRKIPGEIGGFVEFNNDFELEHLITVVGQYNSVDLPINKSEIMWHTHPSVGEKYTGISPPSMADIKTIVTAYNVSVQLESHLKTRQPQYSLVFAEIGAFIIRPNFIDPDHDIFDMLKIYEQMYHLVDKMSLDLYIKGVNDIFKRFPLAEITYNSWELLKRRGLVLPVKNAYVLNVSKRGKFKDDKIGRRELRKKFGVR